MTFDEAIQGMKAQPFRGARRPGWKRMASIFWDSQRNCFMFDLVTGFCAPCVLLYRFEQATDFEWVDGSRQGLDK